MFKRILIISLFTLLTGGILKGQSSIPIDANTGKITYKEHINVDSVTADDFHLRLKTWVIENYLSLNVALQKDDIQNRMMIIKGTGDCYSPKSFGDTLLNGWFTYTLTVEYNDGSFNYTMTDFYSEDKWKGSIAAETFKGSKKQKQTYDLGLTELSTALTTSLKQSMGKRLLVGADN